MVNNLRILIFLYLFWHDLLTPKYLFVYSVRALKSYMQASAGAVGIDVYISIQKESPMKRPFVNCSIQCFFFLSREEIFLSGPLREKFPVWRSQRGNREENFSLAKPEMK